MLQGSLVSVRAATLQIWLRLCLLATSVCGCQTAHFYRQAIGGEYQILANRKPIEKLLSQSETTSRLKEKFELVLQLRQFAKTNLHLPINRHYITYVDLGRQFAVWNVHAAPEFSLRPKKWWYPFVGSLKYQGYFSETDAREYGRQLAQKGDDVYVEGVEAFSTLGWFADPLLNTFVFHGEPDLAEIIFHELAHQRLFLSGDTDFNEAFATAVSEEGVRRWLQSRNDAKALEEYGLELERNRQFVKLVLNARRQLEEVFGERDGKPIGHASLQSQEDDLGKRNQKAKVISDLRTEYDRLKVAWGGYSGYDHWFSGSLNNAQLNTIAVYYDLVPGFKALLEVADGDLEKFFAQVGEYKKLGKPERHRRLHDAAMSVAR